ncbi:hypothetical protein AB4516_00810 [Vibrio sp. 10N.222.54.F12]|uniref:hypothetical protein n=1 Tax=Vibrio TaxID=662 RepID=UPI000C819F71|nr:hypothetical protein [Vibrio tasmaniensis]PML17682.1 hypothetical protein BCT83_08300 [Vibrio tasmaniensis]
MNLGDVFEKLDDEVPREKQAKAALPFANYLEYKDFIYVLYEKLDKYIQAIENDADQMLGKDEDALTSEIIRQLNASELFDAESQVKRGGGAVDLVVKGFGHEWIAEAKKLTTNDKVFEGILQLVTRYVRQDQKAGLLVYIQSGNFADKVKNWKNFLSEQGSWKTYVEQRVEVEYRDDITKLFESHDFLEHQPYTSDAKIALDRGTDLNIRHFFCNLVYKPMDKSATQAKKVREGLAMESLREIYDHSTSVTPKAIDVTEVQNALSLLFREVKK